jgi:hypothetical protein
MALGTGGTIGERAQVILVWVRALSVERISYSQRVGVLMLRPYIYAKIMACRFWNVQDQLNQRCELGDITFLVERCLGTIP